MLCHYNIIAAGVFWMFLSLLAAKYLNAINFYPCFMRFIIEHLDPEVFRWCELEYKHISLVVSEENVVFTNVRSGADKLSGRIEEKSVKELKPDFGKICILDPKAKKTLSPDDASLFDSFLFGGVLGNHPMDGRTEKELSAQMPDCEIRNLGDVQMSTDTAVLVAKRILVDKIPFDKLEFKDEIEIELDDGFSNILPYRYLIEDGKPVLPYGLIDYLMHEDETNQM